MPAKGKTWVRPTEDGPEKWFIFSALLEAIENTEYESGKTRLRKAAEILFKRPFAVIQKQHTRNVCDKFDKQIKKGN